MAKKSDTTVGRRKEILELLSEKGELHVPELSQKFDVSEVTIRNDLDQLEQKKVLIRVRGGALKLENNVAVDQRLGTKAK